MYDMYCAKCGVICPSTHIRNNVCPFCDNQISEVPKYFFEELNKSNIPKIQSKEGEYFRDKYIKDGDGYNESLYNKRAETEYRIGNKIWECGGAFLKGIPIETPFSNTPKCPVCHSASIEKISLGNKVGSVALVGVLAIGHISKTFKCRNCGYKF